jgi:hypothetical protein
MFWHLVKFVSFWDLSLSQPAENDERMGETSIASTGSQSFSQLAGGKRISKANWSHILYLCMYSGLSYTLHQHENDPYHDENCSYCYGNQKTVCEKKKIDVVQQRPREVELELAVTELPMD